MIQVWIKLLGWTQRYQPALHNRGVNQRWAELRYFWLLIGVATGAVLLCSQPSFAQKSLNSISTTIEKASRANIAYSSPNLSQMVCRSNREYFLLNAAPISEEEELTGNYSAYSIRKVAELKPFKGTVKVLTKNDLHRNIRLLIQYSDIALDCTLAFSGEARLKPQLPKITGQFSNGDTLDFLDSGGAFLGKIGCSYYEWCGQPILFLARTGNTSIIWKRAIAYNIHSDNLNYQRTTGDINWVVLRDDSVVGFTNEAILVVFNGQGKLIQRSPKTKYITPPGPEFLAEELNRLNIPESCREILTMTEALKMSTCRTKKSKFLTKVFSK